MTDHHTQDASRRPDMPDHESGMPDRPMSPYPGFAPDRDPVSADVDEAAEEARHGGTLRWILETIGLLLAAFLLAQVVRTYVVQPFVIPTGSMEPTIAIEDRVLVNKFILRFRSPERGDVVVFEDTSGETPALIKRVIAVAGQTVDLSDGRVVVDGVPLDEPYTYGKASEPGAVALPVTVPEGQVWLMGDNRPNSKDSRWIGPQPIDIIEGVAFATYWPPDRIGGL